MNKLTLAALALVASTLGAGCVVEIDEPIDASAELVDDLDPADVSADAVLDEGELLDRQAVLEGPAPELADAQPFDPGVVERERIDVEAATPGVEVGQ